MKITVLDGYALNPGDLSWDMFTALGDVEVFDRTSGDELFDRASDSEAILINKVHIGKEELDRLGKLRYIGITATGYNNVDLAYARAKGVAVTNVPAYSTSSVAQHVFALLLEITDKVGRHSQLVKEGEWEKSRDYCFWHGRLSELQGKTMGIIGMGNIGMRSARIASAFGMDVIYFSRSRKTDAEALGFIPVTFDDLMARSDVVSLHCPLTDSTHHLIDARSLSLMKKDAVLINTSRGPLVDEQALYDALAKGRLQAAALDVLEEEPPQCRIPLMELENCIFTPHTAWATLESRKRLMQTTYSNLVSFMNGNTVNRVN